jgi:hypothetical protein
VPPETEISRTHVIAWKKDLERRQLAPTSVRRKLSAQPRNRARTPRQDRPTEQAPERHAPAVFHVARVAQHHAVIVGLQERAFDLPSESGRVDFLIGFKIP